jgi:hypothetical protein
MDVSEGPIASSPVRSLHAQPDSRSQTRRPIERLVNKGLVERHTLNLSEEEYVLTAAGRQALRDNT